MEHSNNHFESGIMNQLKFSDAMQVDATYDTPLKPTYFVM
jgi:hypothetical protein